MSAQAERSPEYTASLERRYVDLKQILEAMFAHYPPEVTDENYVYTNMVCEFNYLADELGLEDDIAFLDRLIANDDAEDEGGDDAEDDAEDEGFAHGQD